MAPIPMPAITWWVTLVVLSMATVNDVYSRRIPNWLSVPYLLSGLAAQSVVAGWSGAGHSLAGLGLAVLLFGLPCFLRAMGMGDLKLAAGVGAWVGPHQLFLAFIVTGIAGGIMAGSYALFHRSLGRTIGSTGGLLNHFLRRGFRPHPEIRVENQAALSIPYAPAIAIGALLSFFARVN